MKEISIKRQDRHPETWQYRILKIKSRTDESYTIGNQY